jgi:hypothetical protein
MLPFAGLNHPAGDRLERVIFLRLSGFAPATAAVVVRSAQAFGANASFMKA